MSKLIIENAYLPILTEQRNRFVAGLAKKLVIGHATQNGKIADLCSEWLEADRFIYTLALPENAHLIQQGAIQVHDLVQALR